MKRIFVFVLFGLTALAPIGQSSPVDVGSYWKKDEVGAAPWTVKHEFRGGERAAVLAFSDQEKITTNLHLLIFDDKNNLVVEDKAKNSLVGNHVGVIWYPPRTGAYKIELRSADGVTAKFRIAVK